jgi:hypothetical protein
MRSTPAAATTLDDKQNRNGRSILTALNLFSTNNLTGLSEKADLSKSSESSTLKPKVNGLLAVKEKQQFKRISIRRVFVSINNYTAVSNNSNVSVYNITSQIGATDSINTLCYHIAFIQIISTYAFFALIVILIILHQVYLIVYVKRRPGVVAQHALRRNRSVALTGQVTRSKSAAQPLSGISDERRRLRRAARSNSLPARVITTSFASSSFKK